MNFTNLIEIKTPSNTDSDEKSELIEIIDLVVAYLSLATIIIGVFGNTACFLIFRFNQDMKRQSSNVYLSYCSITDTLSLFVWNFDHFLKPISNGRLGVEEPYLFQCKIFSFMQYSSLQASGWLLSFMCIDRFCSVMGLPGSFIARLPFSTTKSAHVWSSLIIVAIAGINLHVLILNGYILDPYLLNVTQSQVVNGSMVNTTVEILYQDTSNHCYSIYPNFSLAAFWEPVHLYIYSFGPFLVMLVFNLLLIFKLLRHQKATNSKGSSKVGNRNNRLTISLVSITILFIVMTLPGAILFGYFYLESRPFLYSISRFLDFFGFLNRASLFVCCLITNLKFRTTVFEFFSRKKLYNNGAFTVASQIKGDRRIQASAD